MRTIRIGEVYLPVANIYGLVFNYLPRSSDLHIAMPEPVVFLKPTSALLAAGEPIRLPSWAGKVQYEIELVVAIGRDGENVTPEEALSHVAGYTVGLDLTCIDVENRNRERGAPWLLGKGFRGAAVLAPFVPIEQLTNLTAHDFWLELNGETRQIGNARHLTFGVAEVVSWISTRFGLQAGDLIYTGTPKGVGALQVGDELRLCLSDVVDETIRVV